MYASKDLAQMLIMFLLLSLVIDFKHKKYLACIISEWYPFSGPPQDILWQVSQKNVQTNKIGNRKLNEFKS